MTTMKMPPAQQEKYELFRSMEWEFYEEFPAAKMIIMRHNASSIQDYYQWNYCTIDENGRVFNGRIEPK